MSRPLAVAGFAVTLVLGMTGCSVATGHASAGGPVRVRCAEPRADDDLPAHQFTFDGLALDAWTGTADSAVWPSTVYDRNEHAYRTVDRRMVSPRPGTTLVAYLDDAGAGNAGRALLWLEDVHTSRTRSIKLAGAPAAEPQWSPDGKRLLVSLSSSTGRPGFTVVDPTDGVVTTRWPETSLKAPYFGWYGDGTKITATLSDGSAIQLYDLDGAAGQKIPVKGTVSGAGSWSPDLRRVVVHTADGNQVVATDTGAVVATLPVGRIPGAAAWWPDATHLLVRSTGEHGAIRLCLATLSGKVTRQWVVPVPGDDAKPPALVVSAR